MTQIQLNGHKYNMAYNMQTAIAYERITGRNPFDLKQFIDGKIEPVITLGYAMLISNNAAADLPDFDEYLKLVQDIKMVNDIFLAVNNEYGSFFKSETGDTKAEDSEEDSPKNE